MSTSIVTVLLAVPLLFALFYFLRKPGSRKAATLGHHLLASGSILTQIRRN
jgi:hypothetical protein